jgi:hypothetical protein
LNKSDLKFFHHIISSNCKYSGLKQYHQICPYSWGCNNDDDDDDDGSDGAVIGGILLHILDQPTSQPTNHPSLLQLCLTDSSLQGWVLEESDRVGEWGMKGNRGMKKGTDV